MVGINVEKAYRLDNGNDTSPWLIKAIEHILATFEKERGYIINEDFLKEAPAIRAKNGKE